MDADSPSPLEAFVPVLAWPGRRPSLAELATWQEALRDAIGVLMPIDLVATWIHPSRGGAVLLGPPELEAVDLVPPAAEPLIPQEGLFALEDRLRAAGYASVMAVPIRAEVQDVGLLVVGTFGTGAYTLDDQRTLHRVAAQLATSCRRLAAHPWITPRPAAEERTAMIAGVTEGLLDAMARARDGADLVQLASDALMRQLPHDRAELVAIAPAPDCWALVGHDRAAIRTPRLHPPHADAIDAVTYHLGARAVARLDDIHALDVTWPALLDRRGAHRTRAVLAARLELGDEPVGWLWLGSEHGRWFREEDEEVARLAARILAPRVAAWAARAELEGVWN